MADYPSLMRMHEALARVYPGWTLADIRSLSPRERKMWLDLAIHRIESRRG